MLTKQRYIESFHQNEKTGVVMQTVPSQHIQKWEDAWAHSTTLLSSFATHRGL